MIEVLAIKLSQISHQVLVDHLVADRGRCQLGKLEFDSVLIEDTLGSFLHADWPPDVKNIRSSHIIYHVIGLHSLVKLLCRKIFMLVSRVRFGMLLNSCTLACRGWSLRAKRLF